MEMKHELKLFIAISIVSSFISPQPLFAQGAFGVAAGHMLQQKKSQENIKKTGEAVDAMKKYLEGQKREIEKAVKEGNVLIKKVRKPGSIYGKDGRISPQLAAKEASSLYELAQEKEKAGKLDDACLLYREALSLRYSVWGTKDPGLSTIAKKIGDLLLQQGKYAEAVDSFKICLQSGINSYGLGAYELCPTLESLGDAYMGQKQYHDAISDYRQVYTLTDRKKGADSTDTIRTMRKYTEALVTAGQYHEAENVIQQHVLPMKDKVQTQSDLKLCMVAYATLLRKTDRVSEAESVESTLNMAQASQAEPAVPSTTKSD